MSSKATTNETLLRVLCILGLLLGQCGLAWAQPTDVEVRVLARGAKFIAGYSASARITLTDADTGEVLAQGMTQGTTGDTQRILQGGKDGDGRRASGDSAVFRTTLDLDAARRITASATGPLAQPQSATTVTSTQWVLPGRHVTAGDGWVLELPGLIVDVAQPVAYEWVEKGKTVPLQAAVTMMCGCALSVDGPWRAGETEVEVHVTVNGKREPVRKMSFDPATGRFGAEMVAQTPGVYEVEVRAWAAASNNAGVGRTAFFVR